MDLQCEEGMNTLVSESANLHVSCIPGASNPAVLRRMKVSGVLSVLSGRSEDYPTVVAAVSQVGLEHQFVDLEDHPGSDLLSVLSECLGFLKRHCREEGGGALVHCHAGLSRSAAVACAYLMSTEYKSNPSSFDAALARIRSSRDAYPNPGFMTQLCIFQNAGSHATYSPDGDGDSHRLPTREELEHRIRMLKTLVRSPGQATRIDIPERLLASDPSIEAPKFLTVLYTCRLCHHPIASDRTVFERTDDVLQVIPVFWMKEQIESQKKGRLLCPLCSAKVGSFNWFLPINFDQSWVPFTVPISAVDSRKLDI